MKLNFCEMMNGQARGIMKLPEWWQ